jgi:hypothetical protein
MPISHCLPAHGPSATLAPPENMFALSFLLRDGWVALVPGGGKGEGVGVGGGLAGGAAVRYLPQPLSQPGKGAAGRKQVRPRWGHMHGQGHRLLV